MGTAERRLEILKYLCKKRHATLCELAEAFDVSVRTIQRDIYEVETTFRVPLTVKCGRYESGVYLLGNYGLDQVYMNPLEIQLFFKVYALVRDQLSEEENRALTHILKKYSGKSG